MIREGLLGGGFRTKPACIRHLETLREEVRQIELKLRRPDQVWCEEGVLNSLTGLFPGLLYGQGFLRWAAGVEKKNPEALHVPPQEAMYEFWGKTCWMVFRMKSPVKERNMPCITRMIPARKMTA